MTKKLLDLLTKHERNSADLGKPILSVVNQLLEKSELRAQGTFNKLTQANERFRAMAANH